MSQALATIILAAGQGKRMNSDLPKVLHAVLGKPMVQWVIEQARGSGAQRVVVIIGHKKELVEETLKQESVEFAVQVQQLGTGHAVQQAEPQLGEWDGDILVLSGDVPLLSIDTLNKLSHKHQSEQADATVLTAIFENPFGYGRIVRNSDNTLEKIVEEKDATDGIRAIKEINSGIYIFKREHLFRYLRMVKNDNAQGEYYLPDILPMMIRDGYRVALEIAGDPEEINGVNTIDQLKMVEERLLKTREMFK